MMHEPVAPAQTRQGRVVSRCPLPHPWNPSASCRSASGFGSHFISGFSLALASIFSATERTSASACPARSGAAFSGSRLSLGFNAFVWWWQGPIRRSIFLPVTSSNTRSASITFSSSVLIFAYFRVPPRYEHRVLIWGILGALVMRATMIWLGVALVSRFHFVLYLFGAFLVVTGLRMLLGKSQPIDLEHNFILRFVRRLLPVTNDYHGPKFIALGRRPADAHAARAGPHRDRSDGPGFRGRLHSRGARDHARHFHCLHLEHLRDPRLALALISSSPTSWRVSFTCASGWRLFFVSSAQK